MTGACIKIKDGANDKIVYSYRPRTDGLFHIAAKTVILAMGCRERQTGVLLTYPATDRQEFSRRAQLRDW